MGLFDNLGGMLQGALGQQGEGEQAQGAMGIIGSLLQQGGGQGQSSNIVGALLGGGSQGGDAQGDGSQGGAQGGMAGMLETLAANGLADHVGSWLGGGNNLPISPEQIHDALGSEQVQQLANSSGLPVGDFLKHLADHLPQAASEASGAADSTGDQGGDSDNYS